MKILENRKNIKIKYLIIILVIIIFNIGTIGLFTNSRYFASINLKAIQDIGYTIFNIAPYDMQNVEGYNVNTNTLSISPREERTVKYKISNVENNYYNEMNLKAYIKVLDENGNELTANSKFSAVLSGVNGASIVQGKGYGPINMDWTGKNLDEKIVNIKLTCTNNCTKAENIKYYIVAEAYNEAAIADSTDGKNGVIVRRKEELNLNIHGEYTIEYELNNSQNSAIWTPGTVAPTSYTLGNTINLVAPISRTQDFDGWYENADFSGTKITNTYGNGNKNLKLYAKWKDKTLHTLKITTVPTGSTINYESNEENVGLKGTATTSYQERFAEGTKIKVKVSKTGYEIIETEITMGTSDISKQIEVRKLCSVSITGVTDASENANIDYSITVPANSPYIAAKSESGTKTGSLTGTYPVGTTINVTVKKDGCETITKSYTVSDNITDTITIRKLYVVNITGVGLSYTTESDATISYTINVPASSSVSANTQTGSVTRTLSGNYPTGTTINVTVSKDGGYESTSKNYTITGNLSDKITITKNFTYTLNVTRPTSGAKITFSIESGQIISGDTSVGTTSKSIKVLEGTVIAWTARADGYFTQTGKVTVTANKTDNLELYVIAQEEYFKDGNNLQYTSKAVVAGTVEAQGQLNTPCSEAESGIGNYLIIQRQATYQVTFVIPSEISDNATLDKIRFRLVCSNGGHSVDYRIDALNGSTVLGSYYDDTSTSLGNMSATNCDIDCKGIKVSELPNRTITFWMTNLETSKNGLNNMYMNVRACDVERIWYKPPAE